MTLPEDTITKLGQLATTVKTKISEAITTHNSSSSAHSTEMAKKLDIAQGNNKATKNVVTDSNGNITTENKPTLTSLSTLTGELAVEDIANLDELVGSACDIEINNENDVIISLKNPEELDMSLIYGEYVGTATTNGYLSVNYQTGEVTPVEFEKITLTVTYDDDTTGTLTLLRG